MSRMRIAFEHMNSHRSASSGARFTQPKHVPPSLRNRRIRLSVKRWQQVKFVPLIIRQVATIPDGIFQPLNLNPTTKKTLMNNTEHLQRHKWNVRGHSLALLTIALALAGCGKPAAKSPERSLVRTALVEPMDNIRSDGEASYIAIVRFDQETDLSFKVGGILAGIGPAAGTDWDEGTPVKAGTVLAELKQADFTNAWNSAHAKAELASKTVERFRKLRESDAISQQELDVTEADWRTAHSQLDQAEQNLRDSRLVATKDGVVLARHVNSRVTVSPGQSVLRFADTSLMSVELGLPDRLVGRLIPARKSRWKSRRSKVCLHSAVAFLKSESRRVAMAVCFVSLLKFRIPTACCVRA